MTVLVAYCLGVASAWAFIRGATAKPSQPVQISPDPGETLVPADFRTVLALVKRERSL